MDYIQVFCGALAVAYFIWVAKSWWNTDIDVLLFQRRVWIVICCALILLLTYSYGVLNGSGAAIQTVVEATHIDLAKENHLGSDQARSPESLRPTPLDRVLVPGWIPFYLLIIWGEISLAITMPERKRTHGQAGAKQQHRKDSGPSTNPDRTG